MTTMTAVYLCRLLASHLSAQQLVESRRSRCDVRGKDLPAVAAFMVGRTDCQLEGLRWDSQRGTRSHGLGADGSDGP